MYCILIDDCNLLNNLFLQHCCLFVSIFFFLLNFVTSYAERNTNTVATSQEMVKEKPGNFTSSQQKVKSLKEVRKKWNFKSTYLFFEHSMDMDRFVLVKNCPRKWTTSRCWLFENIHLLARYVKELSINMHFTLLAVSGGDAVRKLIGEILNLSGNFRNLWLLQRWLSLFHKHSVFSPNNTKLQLFEADRGKLYMSLYPQFLAALDPGVVTL